MLRAFLCAVVSLALAAGVSLAQDKAAKGKGAHGHFESYSNGVLTLKTKKKGEEPKTQEFKVADDTKVTIVNGDDKRETTAKEGFKDVKHYTVKSALCEY